MKSDTRTALLENKWDKRTFINAMNGGDHGESAANNVVETLVPPAFEKVGGATGCIKDGEIKNYYPSMRLYTTNNHFDNGNIFMEKDDPAYNMIRIPHCLSTAKKLCNRLDNIFKCISKSSDGRGCTGVRGVENHAPLIEDLWKRCGHGLGVNLVQVRGPALYIISYMFKEWFNFSFASNWGATNYRHELLEHLDQASFAVKLWNSFRKGGHSADFTDDMKINLNENVDFAQDLIKDVIGCVLQGTNREDGVVAAAVALKEAVAAAATVGWATQVGQQTVEQQEMEDKWIKLDEKLGNFCHLITYKTNCQKLNCLHQLHGTTNYKQVPECPKTEGNRRSLIQKFKDWEVKTLEELKDICPDAFQPGDVREPDHHALPQEKCNILAKQLNNALNLWVYDLVIKSKTTNKHEVSDFLNETIITRAPNPGAVTQNDNAIEYYVYIKSLLSENTNMRDISFPAPIYVMLREKDEVGLEGAAAAKEAEARAARAAWAEEQTKKAPAPAADSAFRKMVATAQSPPTAPKTAPVQGGGGGGGGLERVMRSARTLMSDIDVAAEATGFHFQLGRVFSEWLAFQTPYHWSKGASAWTRTYTFVNPWFERGSGEQWVIPEKLRGDVGAAVAAHMGNMAKTDDSCYRQLPHDFMMWGRGDEAAFLEGTRASNIPLNAATCMIYAQKDEDPPPNPVEYQTKIWTPTGLETLGGMEGLIMLWWVQEGRKICKGDDDGLGSGV